MSVLRSLAPTQTGRKDAWGLGGSRRGKETFYFPNTSIIVITSIIITIDVY